MNDETNPPSQKLQKLFAQDSQKYQVMSEIKQLLESNPGWDMKTLKQGIHEKSIDISCLSSKNLKNLIFAHKTEYQKNGLALILENHRTKEGTIYLREFLNYNINIKGTEKNLFSIIWASPIQISRLRCAEHWYIDATFRICPEPFKQLIIIIDIEVATLKACPCSFILTNSKIAIHYEKIFRTIKDLVTLHDSIGIKLESCTINFERGLHLAIEKIFLNVRMIGCLFHFKQALHRFASKNKLKIKKLKN